jgi:hypothetical protein
VRNPTSVPQRNPAAAGPYESAIPPEEAAFLGGLVASFEEELQKTKEWALLLKAQLDAQLTRK